MHVISNTEPTVIPADEDNDERLVWAGQDERGAELEVVAIRLPKLLLVIHVMPIHYRRRSR